MKPDQRAYYHRHLPHYQPSEATYFITFRLAGTLPVKVVERMHYEREVFLRRMAATDDVRQRRELVAGFRHYSFDAFESQLDRQTVGPKWLALPPVASIVHEAIRYRDGIDYCLVASCVMPNHVHLIINTEYDDRLQERPLFRVLQSLKRYTARGSNKVLRRTGRFWQNESYDHVVRDEAELKKLIWYVLYNPVKAGLIRNWEEWRWTYVRPEFAKL